MAAGERNIAVIGCGALGLTSAILLQQAGAVEALQLDINPAWTAYDYYKAHGHPSDPTPVNLLPDQPSTPYRYYSVYSRDFTVVYAR